MTVIVVGEAVLDRVRALDGQVTEVPGGSPANVAVALQRAGVSTTLRARLSRDPAGRVLHAHLRANDVDLRDAPEVDDPALVVEAVISATGVPAYTFHLDRAADLHWTAEELAQPVPPTARLIHTGSLAASMTPSGPRIRAWATTTGLPISYDINVRPSVWSSSSDREATAEQVAAWVSHACLIKASDEDIAALHPEQTWQEWAAQNSHGRLIVITLGAEGSSAWRDGAECARVAGERVDVVDTVGAGDTFMAWLVAGVLDQVADATVSEIPQALIALSDDVIAQIMHRAGAAAAITCSRRGCNPPFGDEVQSL